MQAYRVRVTIPDDRMVRLPNDVPIGPAEVIVLRDCTAEPHAPSVKEFLHYVHDAQNRLRCRRTKEEIDRYIEEERAGWEDD